jgi:ribose 5-phosphate isomerase A
MTNYKLQAATACLNLITANQVVGLGAGATMVYLADLISSRPEIAERLTLVSSSFKTRQYLQQKGLSVKMASQVSRLDLYFDGCDCFDSELNALKSGGGIHTSEKVLATMADEFVLTGDDSKFVPTLNASFPLVIEILPEALLIVEKTIKARYADAAFELRMAKQKDGAVITENGNLLADLRFPVFGDLKELNAHIKMIPGVVEHSLFYHIATKAIIAGEQGIKVISPQR